MLKSQKWDEGGCDAEDIKQLGESYQLPFSSYWALGEKPDSAHQPGDVLADSELLIESLIWRIRGP